MKIKLPTALRSALLTAMALTAGTAYANPFDPSASPELSPGTTVDGLLVGGPDGSFPCCLPDSVTTVNGNVVVGAGDRLPAGSPAGGDGTLIIGSNLHVTGSIYAGASGQTSFPQYIKKGSAGGDGMIEVTLKAGGKLQVDNSIRLGWLNGKKGTMNIIGGTTTVGGQIVLGFYKNHGGPSLGTTGMLDISDGAQVTATREIFVASGILRVTGASSTDAAPNTTLTGKHLELVGLEQSNFTMTGGAWASFGEVLIGSYGNQAGMSVTSSTVTTNEDFQIYAGTLDMNGGTLDVGGHTMFGNDAGSGDSIVSLTNGSTISTGTLSVLKDAQLTMSGSGSAITVSGEAQMSGEVSLGGGSSLKVLSNLRLNDGAAISVTNSSLEAAAALSKGKVSISLADAANSGTVSVGSLTIESGSLTLTGSGTVSVGSLTTTKGNLIVGQGTTLAAPASGGILSTAVASGTTVDVQTGATATLTSMNLSGNLAVAGEVAVGTLNLNEGCGLVVASAGKLVATTTNIGANMALENTSPGSDSTLGAVQLADKVKLELKGGNKAASLTTTNNNEVTVSSEETELGKVTIDTTSRLCVNADTVVTAFTNAGTTEINNALKVSGNTLSLTGKTTVSGSLTATDAAWNSGNARVGLLINGNTKDYKSPVPAPTANAAPSFDAMLQMQSGLTGDSFTVNVDMQNGISGLSGKTVMFAANTGTGNTGDSPTSLVSFAGTAENFTFLADGTILQTVDAPKKNESSPTHVTVTITSTGGTKTTYGYTVIAPTGGTGTASNSLWIGTGVTFDNKSTTQFLGANEQAGNYICTDNAQVKTESVTDNSVSYSKAEFTELGQKVPTVLVAKTTGNTALNLEIGTQVVTLVEPGGADDGSDKETPINTGAKSWEVGGETLVAGEGTTSTQIGGLDENTSVEDVKGEGIGQLNIATGSKLTVEKLTVEIDQTLSMGEGSSLNAKDSVITIGGKDVKLDNDVYYQLDGQGVTSLSSGLTQKKLSAVSLNLENSTFSVEGFDVNKDGGGVLASSKGVTFENAAVVIKKTGNGTMQLGGTDAQMTFKNSIISGTGTLTNIVMKGGMLGVGNSPGELTVAGGHYDSTALRFFIDPSAVNTDGSGTYSTAGQDLNSLLNFAKDGDNKVVITGLCRMNIQLQINSGAADNPNWTDVSDEMFANQYSAKFTEGSIFQVISSASLENVTFTGTLADGSLPTLQDGLVWNYSQLFTNGTLSVAKGSYADAVRMANTLVSAGETVSGFGQMSRSHVYDVRLNGTNVWATGTGTFLNHSGHNGRSGFEYNAGGYAVGADTIIDRKTVVGIAFGQSFGKQTPKAGNRFYDAGRVDMDSLMLGLYGGTSFTMKSPADSLKLDAYASYGRFDNDSTRRSLSGSQTATASWKENAYAVGATLTRVHEVRENLFFSPFASLDYVYAGMDSFTETAAQDIRYEGSAYQNLSLSLGTGLTRVYRLNGGQELSPFVSVAYVGDLVRKDAKVTSKNVTGALVERSVSPGRNAFQVNVGAGWKITEQWGARAGYTAEFRSGATDQGVNVGVNYAF